MFKIIEFLPLSDLNILTFTNKHCQQLIQQFVGFLFVKNVLTIEKHSQTGTLSCRAKINSIKIFLRTISNNLLVILKRNNKHYCKLNSPYAKYYYKLNKIPATYAGIKIFLNPTEFVCCDYYYIFNKKDIYI